MGTRYSPTTPDEKRAYRLGQRHAFVDVIKYINRMLPSYSVKTGVSPYVHKLLTSLRDWIVEHSNEAERLD